MKIENLFFLLLLAALGCAQGVDMSSTATGDSGVTASGGSKSLFSQWVDNNGFVLIDLSHAAFGSQKPMTLTTATQQSCSCQVLTQGQQSSGTMDLSSCSGNLSYNGMTCTNLNGTATYTLNNGNLTFCQNSIGCMTFH